ncbi:Ras family protein [Histomonas meleagridis]|uniref:Ras family protein n=1 Tax=Histomonas meleagridis TaxID=135588 RepID=UPI00355A559B|nr:Ras family protein [Histomonas meleagridis]KAH0800461.1 Ras family protein [Histomonas meleagridis]
MSSYKIVVVGASGVGKSALVQRLVDGTFREEGQSTVGVEFKSFTCQTQDNQPVKLQIWDTAGQERFRSVSKAYFRNAVGAVLVFDITSESSFDDLENWLQDLQQLCNPNAYIILVGNKVDLEDKREVGTQQAKDFGEKHHLEYLETSALSGQNVMESFTRLAYEIANRVSTGQIQSSSVPKTSPFKPEENTKQDNPCKC